MFEVATLVSIITESFEDFNKRECGLVTAQSFCSVTQEKLYKVEILSHDSVICVEW